MKTLSLLRAVVAAIVVLTAQGAPVASPAPAALSETGKRALETMYYDMEFEPDPDSPDYTPEAAKKRALETMYYDMEFEPDPDSPDYTLEAAKKRALETMYYDMEFEPDPDSTEYGPEAASKKV